MYTSRSLIKLCVMAFVQLIFVLHLHAFTSPAALNTNADIDVGLDFVPQISTDGAGTWIAVWYSMDSLGDTIGTDRDILFAVSTDAGQSWTDPSPLNSSAATDTEDDRAPQITTDGLGTWIATWSSEDSLGDTIGTDQDIMYSISTDAGQSWSVQAPLNSNAASSDGDDANPDITTDGIGYLDYRLDFNR